MKGTLEFPILNMDELDALPDPEWLVEDILIADTRNLIFGQSDVGKTFIAIDLALCIATGKEWKGKRVKKGNVLYICAEGERSIRKRFKAWREENGISGEGELDNVDTLLRTPLLYDPKQTKKFMLALKGLTYDFIVIDTLSTTLAGANENDSGPMTQWLRTVGEIAEQCGSTILTVHHLGKIENKGARGSSTLRCGLDTMIQVKRKSEDDPNLIFSCYKMKDEEKFKDIPLVLKKVTLKSGKTSLLVAEGRGKEEIISDALKAELIQLNSLTRATASEWISNAMPERTHAKYRKELLEKKMVKKEDGHRGYYSCTIKGRLYLTEAE